MQTRRNLLATAALAVVAQPCGRPTHALARELDSHEDHKGEKPTSISHDSWRDLSIGYIEVIGNVRAPCVVTPGLDDPAPDPPQKLRFQPWSNILVTENDLPTPDRMYRGFGFTNTKDKVLLARPVLPPVYTLDDQPLGWADIRGTKIGYASVAQGWFFPWRSVLVELNKLPEESRAQLRDLPTEYRKRTGKDPLSISIIETSIPPDRVSFLKQLSTPNLKARGGKRIREGVRILGYEVGMKVSFGFGDELFSDDEPAGEEGGP